MSSDEQRPLLKGGAKTPEEEWSARLLSSALAEEQEALDQVPLDRIDARLAERLSEGEWPARRTPTRARWVLGGFAVAVAAVALVLALQSPSLTVSGGRVYSEVDGWHSMGQRVALGQLLSTEEEETALKLAGVAQLSLEPHTAVRVLGPDQVELVHGAAQFQVTKRARDPFLVRTLEATTEVVGTVFTVRRADDGTTWVAVTEGAVRVKNEVGQSLVRAGEHWASRPPSSRTQAFDTAAGLVQAGQFDEAKRLYRNLSRADEPSAETALYLLARLEAQPLKRPDSALQVLGEMARRFPQGQLRAERELARIEAFVAGSRCAEATEAHAAFVANFPTVESGLERLVRECH